MGLIVALNDFKSARGDLFWDDGDSIGKHNLFDILLFTEYLKTNVVQLQVKRLQIHDLHEIRVPYVERNQRFVLEYMVYQVTRFFSSSNDAFSSYYVKQ